MAQEAPAISATTLGKRYGPVTALDGIDLQVPPGVIYGFLGPNGAGKTTTIRLLMGFIRPTSGQARMHGYDSWSDGVRARRDVGYLVPADSLYPDMTGQALLDYMATLSGRPPQLRARMLNALELGQAPLGRRLSTYSKGMKQKLALTACMQTAPPLLILDEPADGLDPLIQRAFEHVLAEVRQQGATVFMSSHDLAEVERTCDRVAIIRDGRIVAEETIDELRSRHRRTAEVVFRNGSPAEIDDVPGVELIALEDRRAVLSLEGSVAPLIAFLAERGDVEDLLLTRPSLEDIFLGYYDVSRKGAGNEASEPDRARSNMTSGSVH